jgi:carboxymethylenebutenolidase
MGQMLQFPADGHSTAGYLAVPPSGSGPGVLVIQEWWGLVEHIKHLCDRFAAEGFAALAPDLYHGVATRSPDEAGKLFMALNIARAAADLRGAADSLLDRPQVTSDKIGAVGFCMGGQLALYAGAEFPDRIGAVVDFYGLHPKVRIEPSRIRVPVLAHFAERDNSVKLADAKALVAGIEAAGGSIEAHFYPASHAFFNDSRPTVYDRDCAEMAWTRTLDFLRKHLA